MDEVIKSVRRVKALSVLLGVCIAIKLVGSFNPTIDLSWIDDLFVIATGGWLSSLDPKKFT